MIGTLHAIGVGPGDPELMTIKGKRLLECADVIFVPYSQEGKASVAQKIATPYICDTSKIEGLYFPMLRNNTLLLESWTKATDLIAHYLDEGKHCVFLTLGDPTVYSTYMYVHKRLKEKGYALNIVPGVTSFCASAATSGISLTEDKESLCIIPATNDMAALQDKIEAFENIVLMKVAKNFNAIYQLLISLNLDRCAVLITKASHDEQVIYWDLSSVNPETLSYFTTMIIKKGGFE